MVNIYIVQYKLSDYIACILYRTSQKLHETIILYGLNCKSVNRCGSQCTPKCDKDPKQSHSQEKGSEPKLRGMAQHAPPPKAATPLACRVKARQPTSLLISDLWKVLQKNMTAAFNLRSCYAAPSVFYTVVFFLFEEFTEKHIQTIMRKPSFQQACIHYRLVLYVTYVWQRDS